MENIALAQPIILAIETSQRIGGVALRDAEGKIHVESVSSDLRHDDDLLPAIDRLYKRINLKPTSTTVVGVSIGPGGFTGLRIAITTAKMLAEVTNCKLVAIESSLVACQSLNQQGPIIVALAAKGESCWATRIIKKDDRWQISEQGRLVDASSINLEDAKILLGDKHLPLEIRSLCQQVGVGIIEPSFDPVACVKIAYQLFSIGQLVDPLKIKPLYPREPEAVTLWVQKGHKKALSDP
ncbi:MAG: tRNA (adenosine(37)-N6)-threonylcarbamoyltransferase complex dimerization subunit type 1 TsaB [Planctomycetes bacterium]|nr:tRNA (adenosine(37)-N6)-threonylcarbamoyltransferase complex dimerization subunit type 1 TsaB [Planctomycetota bacterium]